MNKNVELKDEISFDEYKAWLTGLVRGKGNKLPDLNDWKAIKKMTDKVVPDVVEVQNPMPYYVPTPTYEQPEPLPWWETQPTCGTAGQDGNNITITNGASSIAFKDSGDIVVNGHAADFQSPHMYSFDTSKYLIVDKKNEDKE